MLEIGKIQKLKVVRKAEHGAYLGEGEDKVLLPRRQIPEGTEVGDELTVFIYRDSMDRLISTVNQPFITLGQTGVLEVKEITSIGAFLDWGLEKDLLLPYKEQTAKIKAGDKVLAALYVDKSNRLCGTMKVYPYLETTNQYKKDDEVTAWVYEIIEEYGAYAAIDRKYQGMIPKNELYGDLKVGMEISARAASVKEDGKIDLSPRKKAYMQMEDDAELVLRKIKSFEGELPYTDKASPDVIQKDFSMSKNAFKRAVGRLLKEGKVQITDHSIKIIEEKK